MAKKIKRGRLRSVTTRPMYDEKGKTSGYTVSAEHEPVDDGNNKDVGYRYLPPIETPHETKESAIAKHNEHLGGAEAPDYEEPDADDEEQKPMRHAFGRPKGRR